MTSMAIATLRTRWSAFAGALAALALGVGVMCTTALVLASADDSGARQPPQRFAAASAVIRAEPAVRVTPWYGTVEVIPVAEQPALPDAVVAQFPDAVRDRSFPAQLEGGPADQVGHGWPVAAFAPYQILSGHGPVEDDEIAIVGSARVGDRVTVLTDGGAATFTVAGVLAPAGTERAIFFTDAVAARLSPRVDALVTNDPAVADRAAGLSGVQVLTGDARRDADPGAARDRADLIALTAFLGVAALVCGFVTLYVTGSTWGLSVNQRRREIALLRLVGAGPGQVIRMLVVEAMLVGTAGSALGCVLGAVGGRSLAAWMAHRGLAPTWFTVRFTAGSIVALAVTFATGVAVSVLSVLVASLRAGTIRPSETLREASGQRTSAHPVRWLLGFAALTVAVAMLFGLPLLAPAQAADLKSNVELVLLVTAAVALLSPMLLRPFVQLVTLPLRLGAAPITTLVHASVVTNTRRGAAMMAPVLISIGLTAAVIGCVDTGDAAKRAELRHQAGPGDYLVVPTGAGGLAAPLVERIRAIPGVRATVVKTTTVLAYEPGNFAAPIPVEHPALGVDTPQALDLPVRAGRLDALADDTAAVDGSWHKRVGETISLWLADGTPAKLRVVALLDSGLGGQRLVVSLRNAGHASPGRIQVRLQPGTDPARAYPALRAAARTAGATVVSAARWSAELADRQGEQNRVGLVVLLGIVTLYSCIGIANTFLMATSGRRAELKLLRLTGASRPQVARAVAAEALLLFTAGLGAAVTVYALVLASVQTAFARILGTVPITPPSTAALAVAGAALVLALTAAVLPAWRAGTR